MLSFPIWSFSGNERCLVCHDWHFHERQPTFSVAAGASSKHKINSSHGCWQTKKGWEISAAVRSNRISLSMTAICPSFSPLDIKKNIPFKFHNLRHILSCLNGYISFFFFYKVHPHFIQLNAAAATLPETPSLEVMKQMKDCDLWQFPVKASKSKFWVYSPEMHAEARLRQIRGENLESRGKQRCQRLMEANKHQQGFVGVDLGAVSRFKTAAVAVITGCSLARCGSGWVRGWVLGTWSGKSLLCFLVENSPFLTLSATYFFFFSILEQWLRKKTRQRFMPQWAVMLRRARENLVCSHGFGTLVWTFAPLF